MCNEGKWTFSGLISGFSSRPLFLDVTMLYAPTITLTEKATKLCVAKLQAKKESNDLYKFPQMFQLYE